MIKGKGKKGREEGGEEVGYKGGSRECSLCNANKKNKIDKIGN